MNYNTNNNYQDNEITTNNEYDFYKNYLICKSTTTNTNPDINLNIKILKSKLNELEKIIDFYNKYENKVNFDNSFVNSINKNIENIDLLLYKFNKKIISNGQFKNKNIEFEF